MADLADHTSEALTDCVANRESDECCNQHGDLDANSQVFDCSLALLGEIF